MADEITSPIIIKKYANRRLYDTESSSYVTLEALFRMVKQGRDFVVHDARTNEDITRSVLTQIIVEEEGKGENLLPISFLKQLIGFYGHNMQFLVPSYLETSMKNFARHQEHMRTYLNDAFGGLFPFASFEEMTKQNIAMLERGMKIFTPFSGENEPDPAQQTAGSERHSSDPDLIALTKKLDALQGEIERLKQAKNKA